MPRILMTGMCSVQDRFIYHADQSNVYSRAFADPVETYSEVINQFRIVSNTGNYLISEAAYYTLSKSNRIDYLPFWYLDQQKENLDLYNRLTSEYDFVLFVTANILNSTFDLSAEVSVLKKLTIPKVFMSIGVQRRSDLAGALSAGAQQFVEILKSSTSHVFTRGPYAAAFLRASGVVNVYEACCPSAFYLPDQILAGARLLKSFESASRFHEVWVNGYIGASAYSPATEFALMQDKSDKLGYLFQDEPLLLGALDNLKDEGPIYQAGAGLVTKPPKPDIGKDIPDRVVFFAFFSRAHGRARASAVDLLIGRRFHGNLIGLQAGRPAFFIAHDDRVTEMLVAIGFPHIKPDEWAAAPDKGRFLDAFAKSFDLPQFEDTYLAKRAYVFDCISKIVA